MARTEPKKGDQFNEWEILEDSNIGRGGNGSVYKVGNKRGEIAVIKFLHVFENNKQKQAQRYGRFRNEIAVLNQIKDVEGVLPIKDFSLPKDLSKGSAWYVMPLAIPLKEHILGKSPKEKLIIILEVAKILAQLHEREISHRDIKPDNILILGDRLYLADFGLADFPDAEDLTQQGESVGPRWTIAPEMQRDSTNAEGRPADVYSLAKTLWVLIKNDDKCFEGQYESDGIIGIKSFEVNEDSEEFVRKNNRAYLDLLHDLLKQSTNNEPLKRPKISDFISKLSRYISIRDSFALYNSLEWDNLIHKIFPLSLPVRAIWEDSNSIVDILDVIGEKTGLCHVMLPSLGGFHMTRVVPGKENLTAEFVHDERYSYVVKPKRLTFFAPNKNVAWSYFLLETGELNPSGLENDMGKAELVEIPSGEYVNRVHWDSGEYLGNELPENSRLIIRYTRGSFLIVHTRSVYNGIHSGYSAIHEKLGYEEFYEFMRGCSTEMEKMLNQPDILERLEQDTDGLTQDEREDNIRERFGRYFDNKYARYL
jgi:serine/threonine protein kinase